jgi:beta-lactamase regulating signal transducer with metallopeptidase domain
MTQALAGIVNALPASIGLALGTWILLWILRANSPTRYAAWWLCLIAMLAAPALRQGDNQRVSDVRIMAPVVQRPAAAHQAPLVSSRPVVVRVSSEPRPVNNSPVTLDARRIAPAAFAIWAGGFLFSLFRLLRSYVWIRGVCRSARPVEDQDRLRACLRRCPVGRSVRLCWSDDVSVPLAAGFLRSTILLPSSLAEHMTVAEMDEIVIHELAHLARRDDWMQLVERWIGAMFWFHPVVRWTLGRIAFEREVCCDNQVIGSGAGARSYAASLLKLTQLRRGEESLALASTAARRKPEVSKRIEAILWNNGLPSTRISGMRLTAAGVALCLLGAVTASLPAILVVSRPAFAFASQAAPPEPASPRPTPAPKRAPTPPAAAVPKASPTPAPAAVPKASSAPASEPVPKAAPVLVVRERPSGLLGALSVTGYGDLAVDDIINLKNNGVDAGFLYELHDQRIGKLAPGDLIRLRQHNVKPAYLAELLAAYPGLGVGEAIEFQNNGVKPPLVAAVRSLGYGPYTPKEIVQMAQHGVDPDFFHALKEYGIKEIGAAEVIRARDHGVGRAAFREARQYGPNLNISQIIKLKSAGVL